MKIPPISRKRENEHCLNQALQQPAAKGECYWKLYKPIWISLYQYPTDSKEGNIAWRFLHNAVVTPRRPKTKKEQRRLSMVRRCQWDNREHVSRMPAPHTPMESGVKPIGTPVGSLQHQQENSHIWISAL
jgi:hypothetical protein